MRTRYVKIGDILQLERSRITPDVASAYRQIGVYSWGKGIIENDPVPGGGLSKVTYYRFPPKALILSNIQAWEAAIAVSTERHANEFIASQRFLPYIPADDQEVDTSYLKHFFLSDPGMALIRKASPGTVTRNRTLGIKAFESLVIPLPGFEDQCAIASRLDQFDAMQRVLSEGRASHPTLAGALRRQVLSAGIEGHRLTPFQDVFIEVRRDVPVALETTYPMMGVRSFGRGPFEAGPLRGEDTAYGRLRKVQAGDLVYPKLMAWEGAFAVVPPHLDNHYVSPEFCTFELRPNRVSREYVGHLFSDKHFLQQFGKLATGTNVRRRRLQPADFGELTFALPTLPEQSTMVAHLDMLREVETLAAVQGHLAKALPQAARNEVFSSLA